MNTAMRPALFAAVFGLLSATAASTLRAECSHGTIAGWFRLNTPNPALPGDLCYVPFAVGVNVVSVHIEAVPFQKARFRVPDPPFGTVFGENWFYPHSGDRQSGLELNLGDCTNAGDVALGELYVLVETPPSSSCPGAPWQVGDGCEIQSCNGTWLPAQGWLHDVGGPEPGDYCCQWWQACSPLPPYDLQPPDGATHVPLDVVLTWEAPSGAFGCQVYITTDPECGSGQYITVPCGTNEFAPDFLEHGTTYYWSASWGMDACSIGPNVGVSAIHAFTTEGTTPVETSTWGRVKSLYRE